MAEFNSILIFVAIVFWLLCTILIPVFIFHIRNATRKTNKQLQEIIDLLNGKPIDQSRYWRIGLIGDQCTAENQTKKETT